MDRSIEDRDYVRGLCAAGDEAGFFALLQGIERQALSFARRFVRDAELADDALQLANVNALGAFRAGTFDPTKRLLSWYLSVLANAAIDLMRREKRHAVTLSLDYPYAVGDQGAEGTLANLLAVDDDPAVSVETDETRARVRAAVDALPENLRDPIQLSYWRDLRYREIAHELRIAEGTVKSRMSRAARKMREALDKAA